MVPRPGEQPLRGSAFACGAAALVILLCGCGKPEPFPDQIPAIVSSLGQFHSSWSQRDRVRFDSVCTDRELYDELASVWGEDSLAVLTRRIHNPIDSAYIEMTVARHDRKTAANRERYELELFMRREGDRFWIVAHRLTHSLP